METSFARQLPRKYTTAARSIGSTSDLLALRPKRTLLQRVPEPADRQKYEPSVRPSTKMGPTLPSAQPTAAHQKAWAAGH